MELYSGARDAGGALPYTLVREDHQMAETFSDNAARRRFELDVDGQIAFATYRRTADALDILHVEAPVALRGTGAASRLMDHIVAAASTEGLGIVPYCGYARSWLSRHKL